VIGTPHAHAKTIRPSSTKMNVMNTDANMIANAITAIRARNLKNVSMLIPFKVK
jgi:hypothetical protein